MLINTLPVITGIYWNKLLLTHGNERPQKYVSYSLHSFLIELKGKIDECVDDWDKYKKYTNSYEYIHSTGSKPSICRYRPISRAFFKLVEIIHQLRIPTFDLANKQITMFGLAEGPGGFIEASCYYNKNPESRFYGMTIEDLRNHEVPGWKKTRNFLKQNPNVILEKGADGTGDLLNPANFDYVVEKYRGSIDFITGDGGFDFSMDFNSQELMMTKLLFAQIAYAVCLQKKGGSFILKMFDSFYKPTVEMMFLLSSMYEHVHIVKPNMSRPANSERYIVCIGYKYEYDVKIKHAFESIITALDPVKHIRGLLAIKVPLFFYNRMEEINSIFGQNQLDNIYTTLGLIDTRAKKDKIDNYNKQNIQKCVNWCIRHGFDYNNLYMGGDDVVNSNLFLHR